MRRGHCSASKLTEAVARVTGPGNGTGFGVTVMDVDGVAILGGQAHGFYYGLRIEQSRGSTVLGLDASNNWADPRSFMTKAPWLDINAPADLSDRVNLGGGVFVLRCNDLVLENVSASGQENGLDIYHSVNVTARGCVASNNTGWGVHLHNTSHSTVEHGRFNDCVRPGLGDSAGILLVNNSNSNLINDNQCIGSGDGFFIGNENGSPSNFNTVTNNCSHAAANAFEATFSNGNVFENNHASYSGYGFWLGYSYNSSVRSNIVIGCGCGIEIDHGQDNTLSGNTITNTNGPGVVLQTDGTAPFASRPWLHLPAQTTSTRTVVSSNRFGDNNNFHIELRK
jgi:parallel beta-helix repeat protein